MGSPFSSKYGFQCLSPFADIFLSFRFAVHVTMQCTHRWSNPIGTILSSHTSATFAFDFTQNEVQLYPGFVKVPLACSTIIYVMRICCLDTSQAGAQAEPVSNRSGDRPYPRGMGLRPKACPASRREFSPASQSESPWQGQVERCLTLLRTMDPAPRGNGNYCTTQFAKCAPRSFLRPTPHQPKECKSSPSCTPPMQALKSPPTIIRPAVWIHRFDHNLML